MTGPGEPRPVIPHWDAPTGFQIRYTTPERSVVYEKQADGDYIIVEEEPRVQ